MEFKQAIKAYKQAWQNFNFAEDDYIDVAIKDLIIAEKKLAVILEKERIREGFENVRHKKSV